MLSSVSIHVRCAYDLEVEGTGLSLGVLSPVLILEIGNNYE